MNKVSILAKKKLENGEEYCLIENSFINESNENCSDIKINTSNLTIKLGNVRKPISTATIFLTKENDYVGHISANLYNNKTASLIMSGIRGIELPEELKKYREIIENHDAALLVAENYRRQGKAKQLIMLMLKYLDKKGIKDLEVDSISDEIAMQTYLNTGAEKIGDNKAIYRNIRNLLPTEKSEDFSR